MKKRSKYFNNRNFKQEALNKFSKSIKAYNDVSTVNCTFCNKEVLLGTQCTSDREKNTCNPNSKRVV